MKENNMSNIGHGHVFKRDDGQVARCGGPGLCQECDYDLARQQAQEKKQDITLIGALVIKPNDHVLIAIRDDPSPDKARGMMEALRERFPETEFTVISNATIAKVESSDAQ